MSVFLVVLFGYIPVCISAVEVENSAYVLSAIPNKCIALRRGRVCYAKILFKWQATEVGDYCLRRVSDRSLVYCWKKKYFGDYEYDFESNALEQFELIKEGSNQVLVKTKVVIRWVYKSKQRRGQWRIF